MFTRLLLKSISRRRGKVALAIFAVVLGAAVASALLTTSMDVGERVSVEFRSFGANLLLVPRSDSIPIGIGGIAYGSVTDQEYIDEADLPKIKQINWSENVLGYAPYLYSVVETGNQSVVLTGTWLDQVKRISPWWMVEGSWIVDRNDSQSAMVGAEVSAKLGIGMGDSFAVTYSDRNTTVTGTFTAVGIVSTGGSEDAQVFINLDAAQALTGRPDAVSTVQVSALCTACPIETIAAEIEGQIPYVQGKTVRQVAENEMVLLGKIEGMMLLVTAVALSTSAFGVMTTMTTSVVERTKEIGLMRAIGAGSRRIAGLFLAEAVVIGAVGGAAGYAAGLVLAQFIGQSVFATSISVQPLVGPVTLGIAVGIALAGSALPVRRSLRIDPAKVLRGE